MDNTTVDSLQVVLRYIDTISIPICLVCGTFGNIVSFIVYIRKWSNFTIPLVFLSCFDLIFLWTDSIFGGSWAYFGQAMENKSYGCAISAFLYMALLLTSSFTIAMFTVLRAYAVARPLMFAPIFTAKRVVYIDSILTLVGFGIECHYMFGVSNITHNNTTLMYRFMPCGFSSDIYSSFYFNYWVLVEAILILVSIGTIVVGNIAVIISLCRRTLTSNTEIDMSGISRRLIAISTVQVLVWTPFIVVLIMWMGFDRDIGSTKERFFCVLMEGALIPVRLQSGFGFLLYTFIGSEFQAEFRNMICFKTNGFTTHKTLPKNPPNGTLVINRCRQTLHLKQLTKRDHST